MTVAANSYVVSNLIISEVPVMTGDKQVYTKVVRYQIGKHGPFTLKYADPAVTTEEIQADINKQIQQIRLLDNISG